MKHKKIISAVLTAAMLISGASSSIFPVFATSDSDSVIQVTTESEAEDDINFDTSDGWNISIEKTSDASDGKSEDIAISGADDDVVITDAPEESGDGIDVDRTGETNQKENSDIVVNNASTLHASVERTDTKKALDTGDKANLHVVAENKSENAAIFKMYFCNVGDELSDDTSAWSEYLNKPALDMKVQGLDENCTLPVDIKDADGKTVSASLEFLKEVKDDEILSRFAKLELPAGASTDFEFSIMSDKECDVTVIPVMVQETPVFGDADSATWEEDITFFTKVVNFFTGKTAEEEDDGIELSDVQGIEIEADTAGLNEADFASKRLVVLTDDASVLIGKDNVIGQYDNVYLMQFDSVEKTMQAYAYYKDIVTAVEPDMAIEAATSDALNEEDVTFTANDTEEEAAPTTDESNVNPIAALNDTEFSVAVQSTHGVIALIDTGVSEHANVIDRVSMIDNVLTGNGHGDAMVKAIVSQDADAKILSIRAMDDNGFGTVSSLVAAMEYAIEQKVDIINLSLYARTTLSTSVLKQEILKAIDAGITVVGAAGNDGVDVKDYIPGSVEEAYIIGACDADGIRLMSSNYGDTVDYNVVANSTSEAAAKFTGYISLHGTEIIAVNESLIYETDYKDDDIDIENPDDEFETDTDVKPIKDTGEVYPVTFRVNGEASIIFANLDGTIVKTISAKDETVTEDVPMTGVQVEILAPMFHRLDSVDVLDASDTKFVDVSLEDGCPAIVKGVRNTYFVLDKMQEMSISVDVSESDVDIPRFDIPSKQWYFEAELCGADCLKKHVRGKESPESQSVEVAVDVDSELYKILAAMPDEDKVQTAALSQTPVVNKKYTGNAKISKEYFPRGPSHGGGVWSVTFTSGILKGNVVANFTCYDHGAASPRKGFTGDYSAKCTGINGGKVKFTILFSPDNYKITNYQRLQVITTLTMPNGGLSIQKVSGNTSVTNNNSNYSLQGAQYTIYSDSACTKAVKTITTDASGYAATGDSDLGAGTYYVKETKTSKGFTLDTTKYTFTVTGGQKASANKKTSNEPPKTGTINLTKTSTLPDVTYSLAGAEYTVYKDANCTQSTGKVIQTDNSGNGSCTGLPLGTYYVKETKAPFGFMLDPKVYTAACTETGNAVTSVNVASKEEPKTGTINLTKTSTLPDVTNDNKCYSLANAEYTVYTDAACTQSTGKVIKTDDAGKGSCTGLPLGTYYVKETKASPGFKVDPTVYTAACTETGNAVTTVNVASKEKPMNDPAGITITKIQKGDATDTIPSLEGTQFTIKYYDDMNLTKAQVSSATPKRTWIITTKKNSSGKYVAYLLDSYLVSGSDALYKDGNNVIIPLGTVTVQETKPAPGYTLDGSGYLTDKNGNKVSTDTDFYLAHIVNSTSGVALQGGNEYTGYNSTYPLSVKIVKYDSDGKTPLANVQYTIKDKDGNDVKDKNGNVIQPKTTNSSGVATFENLYPNVYYITEIKTKAGLQLLKDPIAVEAPMRMTKDEATANKLDVSDTSKVVWSDAENCYLIFDQTFEVTNHATFTMPMSGGTVSGQVFIPLIFGMGIFTGIAVMIFRKKKRL